MSPIENPAPSGGTARKAVLLIGLDPKVVDFTLLPEMPGMPAMDQHKLAAGLKTALDETNAAGFDAEWCLTDDVWASAEAAIRERLAAKRYAAILIGAGIRTLPAHFLLFERMINLIHEAAPQAKLCFNTAPNTTSAAVLRWIQP